MEMTPEEKAAGLKEAPVVKLLAKAAKDGLIPNGAPAPWYDLERIGKYRDLVVVGGFVILSVGVGHRFGWDAGCILAGTLLLLAGFFLGETKK